MPVRLWMAASLLLSLPAFAAPAGAQDGEPDPYLSITDSPHWYLQASTCTIAHNDGGPVTAWVHDNGMAVRLEFADERLKGIREGAEATLTIGFDGKTPRPAVYPGTGYVPDDTRQGYSLIEMREVIDQLAAARNLQIRRDKTLLLDLDMTHAAGGLKAMEACLDRLEADAFAPDDAVSAADEAMPAQEGSPAGGAETPR